MKKGARKRICKELLIKNISEEEKENTRNYGRNCYRNLSREYSRNDHKNSKLK